MSIRGPRLLAPTRTSWAVVAVGAPGRAADAVAHRDVVNAGRLRRITPRGEADAGLATVVGTDEEAVAIAPIIGHTAATLAVSGDSCSDVDSPPAGAFRSAHALPARLCPAQARKRRAWRWWAPDNRTRRRSREDALAQRLVWLAAPKLGLGPFVS
jgi:hypothetical protein